MKNHFQKSGIVFIACLALFVLAGISYGGYRFRLTVLELRAVKETLATTTAEFQKRIATLEDEKQNLTDKQANLEQHLSLSEYEKTNLSSTLASEQAKNNTFETQIQAIGNTVGTLEKLSKTDKELLQKYSKVYFLNEHYIPSNLTSVPPDFVYEKDKFLQIHSKVLPFLSRLADGATANGTPLRIISAYRSFIDQAVLKSGYKVTYGAGANKFSADQGYSEHQLGTTIDFTTPEIGLAFTKFESTPAYAWLVENAYRYGFVLSYPKQNGYYQFEPWHWRFVGVSLAMRLHNGNGGNGQAGQYFYDLDQREIDSYLISIFD